MTPDTPYDTGDDWQDAAKSRSFKPDPYFDKLLAQAERDPDSRDRLDTTVRMNLAMYQDLKEATTRHAKGAAQ